MLAPIVDAITGIINWLYGLTVQMGIPSYGVAIILFTILLKTVLYPLTLKQMRSMVMMQQLAPKIKEIQTRYKGKDNQKMQEKMMELYKEHNVNPMSGCLPLLVQMPILYSLFMAMRSFPYANVEHASFLFISHLSEIDNGPFIFGLPIYALAIVTAATTFLQSKLTTNMTDQTQKMMLYMMPVMIGYFTTMFPAGLALYWITFNILGIAQQYFVNKKTLAIKEGFAQSADTAVVRKNRKNSR